MEPRQGRPLSAEQIQKMRALLATSNLNTPEIAARMGYSPGRVDFINPKLTWVRRRGFTITARAKTNLEEQDALLVTAAFRDSKDGAE